MTLSPDDPRVAEATTIGLTLNPTPMTAEERMAHRLRRKAILTELRAEGHEMTAIAAALGMSRANLYALLGPVDDPPYNPTDHP